MTIAIRFGSLLMALVASTAQAAPTPPTPLEFDGEAYLSAGIESNDARHAEQFVRVDESLLHYSRLLTIADQPRATSVKQIGLGVLQLAKLRTPGLEALSFAADGAEDRDLTVTWFELTDDGAAVEFHSARFVALIDKKGKTKGVREYHFVAREYTNGRDPDSTLAGFQPVVAGFSDRWVEQLQHLDRAPADPKSAK